MFRIVRKLAFEADISCEGLSTLDFFEMCLK